MGCEEEIEDIAYVVDGTGPDGQFQWGIDDLKQGIRKTLADYLSCVTSNPPGRNDYTVPSGFEEGSYRDSEGNPAAIQTGGPYQNSAYSTDRSLDRWSNPFLDALADDIHVSDYLTKGETGHKLLQDVQGADIDTTGKSTHGDGKELVEQQVSQVLRNNRFNPTGGRTPFITGDTTPDPPRLIPTENSLGAYRDPITGEVLGTEVSVEDMQKIALSLMLKATGEDTDGTLDPDSATGLKFSNITQTGVSRLDPKEMEARRAFGVKDLHRVALKSDMWPHTPSDDGKSYGQLNSFLEPFDGFLPLGMIALAATTSAALIASSAIIFGILQLVPDSTVTIAPGPYVLGQHGPPEAEGILGATLSKKTLGLVRTQASYQDAAFRGINVFFGLTGDDRRAVALNGAINLLTAPGYYAITARAIFRSLNTISNAVKDIDFSNPVAGVQAVLGLVDVIKSSKIIGFFNVLASLGDAVLRLESQGYTVTTGETKLKVVSTVDKLPDSSVTRVMKSRSSDGTSLLSLAWRASSTPSAFVFPSSLALASSLYSGKSSAITNLTCGVLGTQKRNDGEPAFTEENVSGQVICGRISPDIVKDVENALESEYVPFYFHDLRTNEIVSFHAFLASLTDNYTADYETIDAYGRVDPIKIYMKTTRQIALSFHVVATSRDDFDVMWWKINKLITLLYPQWSKGNVIEMGDDMQFVQPFSQIPTASPLIRLRIGDVIRSNYSKFNLARVFGLGQPDMIAPNIDNISSRAYGKSLDIIAKMISDPDQAWSISVINGGGYAVGQKAYLRPNTLGYQINSGLLGSSLVRVKVTQNYLVEISKVSVVDTDSGQKTQYVAKIIDPIHTVQGEEVVCTHGDLAINPDYVYEQALNDFQEEQNESLEQVSSFFSSGEGGNPVVRAFESARGRGLAGVIESMNFDWYEPTWETDAGARAPKWCKVEISFSPIHDIPPGLDSDGFNRAPVYPVGATLDAMGDVYDEDIRELVKSKILEAEDALKETSG